MQGKTRYRPQAKNVLPVVKCSMSWIAGQMKSTSRVNAFAFFLAEAVRHFSDEELRFFPDCALPSHFLVYLGLLRIFQLKRCLAAGVRRVNKANDRISISPAKTS